MMLRVRFLYGIQICHWFSSIRAFGILSLQLSLVSVAFERAVATWKYRSYEKMTNPVLVLVGIAIQWVLAGLTLLKLTSLDVEWMPLCNFILFASAGSQLPSFIIILSTELLAGTLYLVVLLENNKKKKTTLINQALHSLTVRFQLSENIRSTRMMLPSLLSHMGCYIPVTLIIIPTIIWHEGNRQLDPHTISTSAAIFEICNFWTALYGLCHPIICIIHTPKFSEAVRRGFKKNAVAPQTPAPTVDDGDPPILPGEVNEAMDDHFKMLPLHWKTIKQNTSKS